MTRESDNRLELEQSGRVFRPVEAFVIAALRTAVDMLASRVDTQLDVIKAQTDTIARQELTIRELSDTIWRLMHDDVVDSFLNRSGWAERMSDTEISEALKEGNCGMIAMDIRFLKFINDKYSHNDGDDFLRCAAEKIEEVLDENIRTVAFEDEFIDLRRENAPEMDVRIRYGGDEFIIFVQNATLEQLQAITERLRTTLSVDAAKENQQDIKPTIPVIASVAPIHASFIKGRDVTAPKKIFERMMEAAHMPLNTSKELQYGRMWQMLTEKNPIEYNQRPLDDRDIARLFLQEFCQNFLQNREDLLAK